jgi:4'-phosphopantetheinyl transferase EntD
MEKLQISTYYIDPEEADIHLLTVDERVQLRSLRLGNERSNEWIRGRLAIHRSIRKQFGCMAREPSVLCNADGSPIVKGAEVAVSLSHDGDYFAVVACEEASARVGIDLCLRQHEARTTRILSRCGIYTSSMPATLQWSVVEAALKLRRSSVTSLLGTTIELNWTLGSVMVSGIGQPAHVHFRTETEYSLAWTGEQA